MRRGCVDETKLQAHPEHHTRTHTAFCSLNTKHQHHFFRIHFSRVKQQKQQQQIGI